jgi:two-component system chemotaxis response regulator CheB
LQGHDIIVMGASAGGVEALQRVVAGLPPDLPAAVFVVLHISADGPSLLPKILKRAGSLVAAHAKDGEEIQHGRIYAATPDHHLLVQNGHIRVVRGPRENHHRSAIDPLFRTAAHAYGPRVVEGGWD